LQGFGRDPSTVNAVVSPSSWERVGEFSPYLKVWRGLDGEGFARPTKMRICITLIRNIALLETQETIKPVEV
jgi:hypothetical protein